MKMFDRILASGQAKYGLNYNYRSKNPTSIKVIDCQNVFEYIIKNNFDDIALDSYDTNGFRLFKSISQFCLTPPFDDTFLEVRPMSNTFYSVGLNVSRFDLNNELDKVFYTKNLNKIIELYSRKPGSLFPVAERNGSRWFVIADGWVQVYKREMPYPCRTLLFFWLNEHGYATHKDFFTYAELTNAESSPSSDTVKAQKVYYLVARCILHSLAFLNCKNVEMIENVPPPKLSVVHEKKHGEPLVTFKTIKVNPLRSVKHLIDFENKPDAKENAIDLPLHITRGHFKDYRDSKGLFGNPNLRGVYWFDQHLRGSVDNGVVIKDYEVEMPSGVNNAS